MEFTEKDIEYFKSKIKDKYLINKFYNNEITKKELKKLIKEIKMAI